MSFCGHCYGHCNCAVCCAERQRRLDRLMENARQMVELTRQRRREEAIDEAVRKCFSGWLMEKILEGRYDLERLPKTVAATRAEFRRITSDAA